MTIEESVIQKLRGLPPERQCEVLNFVEFLETEALIPRDWVPSKSVELAEGLVGSLDDGPGDLATNREHLKGYGV